MAERPGASDLAGWLDYIDRIHPRDIEMGLDRLSGVARRLDVLTPAPTTVIVAGTNGKGSTCVALERLLLEAGLSVGTTLSPHVARFNERVRLNGVEAEDALLSEAFAGVDAARDDVPLTYFEFAALAALLTFKRAGVAAAILEVGLGGRLDAFNVVDADLAIVTSIGLDHQDFLGDDLESIGREKAGVFRQRQRVVLGRVTESVHAAAAGLGCQTLALDRDFQVTESASTWSYCCPALDLAFPALDRGPLAPSNCALALTAAALLGDPSEIDASVLARVALQGRMERFEHRGVEVVVDVAHNPAGAKFLAEQLEQAQPGRRYVAIIGMLADKDAAGVADALDRLVTDWIVLPTRGWRAQPAESLAARLARPCRIAADMPAALEAAVSLTAPGDGILAFGSFSAVEQARELLIDPPRQPVDA